MHTKAHMEHKHECTFSKYIEPCQCITRPNLSFELIAWLIIHVEMEHANFKIYRCDDSLISMFRPREEKDKLFFISDPDYQYRNLKLENIFGHKHREKMLDLFIFRDGSQA